MVRHFLDEYLLVRLIFPILLLLFFISHVTQTGDVIHMSIGRVIAVLSQVSVRFLLDLT